MGHRLPRAGALILGLALAGCATSAAPPGFTLGEPAELGRGIAQRRCSGCHAMTPGRPSPDRGAPAFWAMAGRHTPDSLAQATATTASHDRLAMPQIVLTRGEAAAILAYSVALSKAPRSAWRDLDVAPCIATARC